VKLVRTIPARTSRIPTQAALATATKLLGRIRRRPAKFEVIGEETSAASLRRIGRADFVALETTCKQLGHRERKHLASQKNWTVRPLPGWTLTTHTTALQRLAVITGAPPLPATSTLLSCAIPAALAEVPQRLAVLHPSTNPVTLAATYMAELTDVVTGDAEAALAAAGLGAGLPLCDMVVAPYSSRSLALAALLWDQQRTSVLLTGTDDLMVLCEGEAAADQVTMELLGHCERQPHGRRGLVTPNKKLLSAVRSRLKAADADLDATIYLLSSDSMTEACDLASRQRPDRIWLLAAQPDAWIPLARSTRIVHVGPHAPPSLDECGATPITLLGRDEPAGMLFGRTTAHLTAERHATLAPRASRLAAAEGRVWSQRAAMLQGPPDVF